MPLRCLVDTTSMATRLMQPAVSHLRLCQFTRPTLHRILDWITEAKPPPAPHLTRCRSTRAFRATSRPSMRSHPRCRHCRAVPVQSPVPAVLPPWPVGCCWLDPLDGSVHHYDHIEWWGTVLRQSSIWHQTMLHHGHCTSSRPLCHLRRTANKPLP